MPEPTRIPMSPKSGLLALTCVIATAVASCSPRTVSNEAGGKDELSGPSNQQNTFTAPSSPDTTIPETPTPTPFHAEYASSPIPWQPWDAKTLEAARESKRPILIHAGYSTCPFTRKLRQSALSNPAVVAYLREHFVCILVDSEDNVAMNSFLLECLPHLESVPAWPMLLWATPDGKPFLAHDFAQRDGFSLQSILSTARNAHKLWLSGADFVGRMGEEITAKINPPPPPASTPASLDTLLTEASHQLNDVYDSGYGTVSAGQNFPRPTSIGLLLTLAGHYPESSFRRQQFRDAAATCLNKMREGAILDTLDHTFHRYSEKPNWDAPHSEKLLADQALLSLVYISATAQLKDPSFLDTAHATLDAVAGNWKSQDGLYQHAKSAFAADSAQTSPPFLAPWFTWSVQEVRSLLAPPEAEITLLVHGLRERGNMPPALFSPLFKDRPNVLPLAVTTTEAAARLGITTAQAESRLASAHAKLRAARESRPGAFTDGRATVTGNALLLSAFSIAATTGGGERFRQHATDLYARLSKVFLAKEARIPSTARWLDRPTPSPASHADYATLIQAFLDYHQLTNDSGALQSANALQDTALREFFDATMSGFRAYPPGILLPISRPWIVAADTAIPSDNAIAAANLRRLAKLTGNQEHAATRAAIFRLFARLPDQAVSAHALLAEFAHEAPLAPPVTADSANP